MKENEVKQAISTIEYMLARCPYNERQQKALETALTALKLTGWEA